MKTINNSKGPTHLPVPNSCEGNSLRHRNITWNHCFLIQASSIPKIDDSVNAESN